MNYFKLWKTKFLHLNSPEIENFIRVNKIKNIRLIFDTTYTPVNLIQLILPQCENIENISFHLINDYTNLELILYDLFPDLLFIKLPKNIQTIGDYFLLNRISLEKIDLTKYDNLITIGNYFVSNYVKDSLGLESKTKLKTVILPISLVTIGDFFLYYRTSLELLVLSFCENLTTIGNFFLYKCISLPNLDLSRCINLTTIGNNFLTGGNLLQELDLSNCVKLTSIGFCFLDSCSEILNLILPKSITFIDQPHFLMGCNKLKTITGPQIVYDSLNRDMKDKITFTHV